MFKTSEAASKPPTATAPSAAAPIAAPVAVAPELITYYCAVQGCRSVEEFECLNKIEEGAYGVVYRAKDKKSSRCFSYLNLQLESYRKQTSTRFHALLIVWSK